MTDISVSMVPHRAIVQTDMDNLNPWDMVRWNVQLLLFHSDPYIEYSNVEQVDTHSWICMYSIPLWCYVQGLFNTGLTKADAMIKCWDDELDEDLIEWASEYWDTLAQNKAVSEQAEQDAAGTADACGGEVD